MAFNKNPTITLTHIDTNEYESVNATGNKVAIDMYDADQKRAQSPTELLLSAVASCSAVDVAEILKKRKKAFTHFTVEAKGNRQEEHPRYFKEITLTFKVTSDNISEMELIKNATTIVEKYCGVATTISGNCKIHILAEVTKPN